MPTRDEIIDALEEREDEVLQIQLTSSAQRTAVTLQEYIDIRLLNGISPGALEAELLADLNEGGRIFGEFRNTVKATARGNVRRVSDIGNYSENGIEIKYTWVTVGDERVCPDCIPLNNETKTWQQWEESPLGLPRSGGTVCRSNCRCFLAMSDAPALPQEPINRPRRSK